MPQFPSWESTQFIAPQRVVRLGSEAGVPDCPSYLPRRPSFPAALGWACLRTDSGRPPAYRLVSFESLVSAAAELLAPTHAASSSSHSLLIKSLPLQVRNTLLDVSMATPGLFSILSLPVLSPPHPHPKIGGGGEAQSRSPSFSCISRMNRSFAFGGLARMNYREGLALALCPCVPHCPFRASTLPSCYGVSSPIHFHHQRPQPRSRRSQLWSSLCLHFLLKSLQSSCLALIFRSLLCLGFYH